MVGRSDPARLGASVKLLIVLFLGSFSVSGLFTLIFGFPKSLLAIVVFDVAGIAFTIMEYNRGSQDAFILLVFGGWIIFAAVGFVGVLLGMLVRKKVQQT